MRGLISQAWDQPELLNQLTHPGTPKLKFLEHNFFFPLNSLVLYQLVLRNKMILYYESFQKINLVRMMMKTEIFKGKEQMLPEIYQANCYKGSRGKLYNAYNQNVICREMN